MSKVKEDISPIVKDSKYESDRLDSSKIDLAEIEKQIEERLEQVESEQVLSIINSQSVRERLSKEAKDEQTVQKRTEEVNRLET